MRLALPMVLALALLPTGGARAQDDDDPKEVATHPHAPSPLLDEDDPKLVALAREMLRALEAPVVAKQPAPAPPAPTGPERPTPAVTFSYRRLTTENIDATATHPSSLDFDVAEIDAYGFSQKWIRLGIDMQLGIGTGSNNGLGAWYVMTGLQAGVQYPWRVTPFAVAKLDTGIIGGDIEQRTVFSYIYSYGIDVGTEVYLVDRLYLSLAIGWQHPVYHAIDLQYAMQHPGLEPISKDFVSDTFTFRIGLGL